MRVPGAILLLSCHALLLRAGPVPAATDPWNDLRELRFSEALGKFDQAAAAAPTIRSRQLEYGAALAALNLQPKTRGTIAEARRRFTDLATTSDDIGLRARYFLARIAQIHAYEPDWAEAARLYRSLLHDHPEHPCAQLGAAKLALILLYDPAPPAKIAQRFAELESLGSALTLPAARRDFHYTLGVAAIFHHLDDEAALRHLLASAEAGMINDQNRANVHIRIAETALALHRPGLAREHLRLFLEAAPRDVRTRYAREQLARLDSSAP